MACWTRSRVSAATRAVPLTTFDTVLTETPAAWATSLRRAAPARLVVRAAVTALDPSLGSVNYNVRIRQPQNSGIPGRRANVPGNPAVPQSWPIRRSDQEKSVRD